LDNFSNQSEQNRHENGTYTTNIDKSIQIAFEKYLNELNVDMTANIFESWHHRKGIYPRLHALM
jgi:hypothetical protein